MAKQIKKFLKRRKDNSNAQDPLGSMPDEEFDEFGSSRFSVKDYVDNIFTNNTLQEVKEKDNLLERLKEEKKKTKKSLKKVVYHNYDKFIETSQEIELFLEEIIEINHGLSGLKQNIGEIYKILEVLETAKDRSRLDIPNHFTSHVIESEKKTDKLFDQFLDLEVRISEQRFLDALDAYLALTTTYKSQITLHPYFSPLLDEKKKKFQSMLVRKIYSPMTRMKEFTQCVHILSIITNPMISRKIFLECRTNKIHQELRNIRLRGDLLLYIQQITSIKFSWILRTEREFRTLFLSKKKNPYYKLAPQKSSSSSNSVSLKQREQHIASFIQWVLGEFENFVRRFKSQVFVPESERFDRIADCVKELFRQSEALEHDGGISVTFRLEQLLKIDICQLIQDFTQKWMNVDLKRSFREESWQSHYCTFPPFQTLCSQSCEVLFDRLIHFTVHVKSMRCGASLCSVFLNSVEDLTRYYQAQVVEFIHRRKILKLRDRQYFCMLADLIAIKDVLLPWIEIQIEQFYHRNVSPEMKNIGVGVIEVKDTLISTYIRQKSHFLFTNSLGWTKVTYPGDVGLYDGGKDDSSDEEVRERVTSEKNRDSEVYNFEEFVNDDLYNKKANEDEVIGAGMEEENKKKNDDSSDIETDEEDERDADDDQIKVTRSFSAFVYKFIPEFIRAIESSLSKDYISMFCSRIISSILEYMKKHEGFWNRVKVLNNFQISKIILDLKFFKRMFVNELKLKPLKSFGGKIDQMIEKLTNRESVVVRNESWFTEIIEADIKKHMKLIQKIQEFFPDKKEEEEVEGEEETMISKKLSSKKESDDEEEFDEVAYLQKLEKNPSLENEEIDLEISDEDEELNILENAVQYKPNENVKESIGISENFEKPKISEIRESIIESSDNEKVSISSESSEEEEEEEVSTKNNEKLEDMNSDISELSNDEDLEGIAIEENETNIENNEEKEETKEEEEIAEHISDISDISENSDIIEKEKEENKEVKDDKKDEMEEKHEEEEEKKEESSSEEEEEEKDDRKGEIEEKRKEEKKKKEESSSEEEEEDEDEEEDKKEKSAGEEKNKEEAEESDESDEDSDGSEEGEEDSDEGNDEDGDDSESESEDSESD